MDKERFLNYLQSIFTNFDIKIIDTNITNDNINSNIKAEYKILNNEIEILDNLYFSLNLELNMEREWYFIPNFENINFQQTLNYIFEDIKLDLKQNKLNEIVSIVKSNEQNIFNNLLNLNKL